MGTSRPGGRPAANISALSFARMTLKKRSFKRNAAAQSRLVRFAFRDRIFVLADRHLTDKRLHARQRSMPRLHRRTELSESDGMFRPAVKTATMRASGFCFHIRKLFEVSAIEEDAG
jgi:hypothetical protein